MILKKWKIKSVA